MTQSIRTGRCLCGGITFRIKGDLRPVLVCHCLQCRKTSGHYWAATEVHCNDIDIRDAGALRWYRSSNFARRGFCNRCGASMFWQKDARNERISVGAGCIDAPTGLNTEAHIFVESASDYYRIPVGEEQRFGES